MKKVKRLLRVFVFICLIILAGIGVGLSGGVPIPSTTKRDKKSIANSELVETIKSDTETKKGGFKS